MPLLMFGGWLAFNQPASGLDRGAEARLAPLAVSYSPQAIDTVSLAARAEPPLVSGEFVAAPTAGLPDPMCTSPPGQRRCAVSSLASNAQGDVFAAFANSPFSPGDLGLYRLPDDANRWERVDVADPDLPVQRPAPFVPAVAISGDGAVFALGFWAAGGDGYVFRSLDSGATWQMYARVAAGTSLIAVDRTDTFWVGSTDGLLRSLHPAGLSEQPADRTAMLDRVRTDCFVPGARAGQLVEFPDGSFQCRFPDGALITCSPGLLCTISGPSGVTGPYPSPG
jgi:hypothetical protein